MSVTADAFRTLGISPTASLDEATTAYKDLIRVWHPDRFGSDPRLRAKAEEQTRLLNQAIAHLRKALQGGPHQQKHDTLNSAQRAATHTPPTQTPPFIKTLELRRIRSRIVRSLLTYAVLLIIGACNVTRLESTSSPSMEFALSALLVIFSLSHILVNIALFFFNTPIISVNMAEMRIIGLPRIPITEIWEIWFSTRSQELYLRLNVTDAYLTTLPRETRLWLKLMKSYMGFHVQIPCSALDAHPSHIMTIVELVNMYGAVPLTTPPQTRLRWAIHANSLAVLCALVLVLRCFVEHDGYEVSYLPYLIIYLAARGYSVVESVVLAPRC